jgi:hypothetical protein
MVCLGSIALAGGVGDGSAGAKRTQRCRNGSQVEPGEASKNAKRTQDLPEWRLIAANGARAGDGTKPTGFVGARKSAKTNCHAPPGTRPDENGWVHGFLYETQFSEEPVDTTRAIQ